MTTKKKRKARTRAKAKAGAGYRAPVEAVPGPERPRASLFGSILRPAGDTALPKIRTSVARGFVTVGSSPFLLVAPFVVVLAGWLGLVALGLETPPSRLAILMALPPISTVYFDAAAGVMLFGYGAGGLAAGIGLLLVRALVLAVLSGAVVERLEGGADTLVGVRRGLRAFPYVLAANMAGLSLALIGSFILPVLGPGLGFLGSVMILVAGLFFLVFVPVAAIREGRGLNETLRRSARAALLPGGRHLLMAMLYLLLVLVVLVALVPSGALLNANPSIFTWVFALVATFVHVSFLAAFYDRWMVVEPDVPDRPVRRRR